jgi:hypothetical protein
MENFDYYYYYYYYLLYIYIFSGVPGRGSCGPAHHLRRLRLWRNCRKPCRGPRCRRIPGRRRIAQARVCEPDHTGSQEHAVPGSQGINSFSGYSGLLGLFGAFYFVEFRVKLRLGDAFRAESLIISLEIGHGASLKPEFAEQITQVRRSMLFQAPPKE